MPGLSSQERTRQAAIELTDALRTLHPASPLRTVPDIQLTALKQLANIFQQTHNDKTPQQVIAPVVLVPRVQVENRYSK